MKQLVEFEISGQRWIEPEVFNFAVLIGTKENPDYPEGTLHKVEELIRDLKITEVKTEFDKYVISGRKGDSRHIKVLSIQGRKALDAFIDDLKKIAGIEGGIIGVNHTNQDDYERDLIAELLQEGEKKARNFARLISKKIVGIVGLKIVDEQRGKWKAHPPFESLDKKWVYQAILVGGDQQDKIEMRRKVVVTYEFG